MQKTIIYFTSVGGGVFGETLNDSFSKLKRSAWLHSLIPLSEYWKEKSNKGNHLLRLKMYIIYPIQACLLSLFSGPNVHIVSTNPFFLPALLTLIGKLRGHRVINLVFDLYPEALIYGGSLEPNSVIAKACKGITRFAVRHSDATVYISKRFGEHVELEYGPSPCSKTIAVGSNPNSFTGFSNFDWKKSKPVLLYSGHMGRLHDYMTLVRCLSTHSSELSGLSFHFFCNGPHYEALKYEYRKRVSSYKRTHDLVSFESTLDQAEWSFVMRTHPIGIVTLLPGGEKTAMPSKTYSALLAGQAILAICPRESDLADLVIENDVGWHVKPGDWQELTRVLRSIADTPEQIEPMRRRAHALAHREFSVEAVARQYLELIEGIQ